jgi:hypothetical protein
MFVVATASFWLLYAAVCIIATNVAPLDLSA